MSIDSQIRDFIERDKKEDIIPSYLKDLFRSVQQESSGQPSVGAFGSDLPGFDDETGMAGLGFGSLESASAAHDSYAAGTLSNAGLRDALGVKDIETAKQHHMYNRMARKVRPLVIQAIDYLGTTAKRSAVEQAVSKAMEERGLEAATKETMAQINSIAEDVEGPGSVADADAAETARDQEGFGGPSSPDSRGGPSQGGGTSGSGIGGTGESGSMGGDTSAAGHESPGGDYFNTGGRVGALIKRLQSDPEEYNEGGTVTVDKSFVDRSDNTTKTVAIEYDTTTGKATQESIDKVRDTLGLSRSNITNPAIQELSRPNFSIMSTAQLEALKEALENPEQKSFSLIEALKPDFKTDEGKFQGISTLLGAPPLLTPLGIKGFKAAERRETLQSVNRALNNREEEAESQVQASTVPTTIENSPQLNYSIPESLRDDKLPGPREPDEFYASLARARSDKFNPNWKSVSTNQALGTTPTTTTTAPATPSTAAPPPEQAAQDRVLDIDVGSGAGIDVGLGAPDIGPAPGEVGFGSAQPGPYAIGGEVENAETDLGNADIAMGVVDDPDGAPSPFSGGTGVEDDLDMEVEAGSYVLNAESVQLIGISDINAVIRDAYAIAAALGKPMPQDFDPQNKVPIRISNGEAVIPKSLVDIIGLDKLEKWNKKGLELRKQKEKFMAQQQQAQPPQGPQVAAEAPMQQQMGQLMANGSLVEGLKQVGRGKAVDFGPLGKVNIGFDLYDKESTLEAADLAGSLLGTTKEQKRNAINLMRRTAAVESDLGTTIRDINRASGEKEGFTIGPFQVTRAALKDIQERIGDPFHKGMNANIKKIKQHPRFKDVDFKTIDVDDLKDPYINAIISRLYYTTKAGAIPKSLKEQAVYWKEKYNTYKDKRGKVSAFIDKAKKHNL